MIKDKYNKAKKIREQIWQNTNAIAFWVNDVKHEGNFAYLPPNYTGTTTAQKTPHKPDPDAFQVMRTATIQALESQNAALELEFADL